jgi:hypothetical protein
MLHARTTQPCLRTPRKMSASFRSLRAEACPVRGRGGPGCWRLPCCSRPEWKTASDRAPVETAATTGPFSRQHRPAQPPENRTCRFPRIRPVCCGCQPDRARSGWGVGRSPRYLVCAGRCLRGPSGTAPAVDENPSGISGGGVAAHHDVGVAALLEVRIEGRFAGHAPARLRYLGESAVSHKFIR